MTLELQQAISLRQQIAPLCELLCERRQLKRDLRANGMKIRAELLMMGKLRLSEACLTITCFLCMATTCFGQTNDLGAKLTTAHKRAQIQLKSSQRLTASRAMTAFTPKVLPVPKVKDKLWWKQLDQQGREIPLPVSWMEFDGEWSLDWRTWTRFARTNQPPMVVPASVRTLPFAVIRVGRHDK